jgi:hypothetical protein
MRASGKLDFYDSLPVTAQGYRYFNVHSKKSVKHMSLYSFSVNASQLKSNLVN